MRRFLHGPDADPLALTDDTAERLLSGRPSPGTPPAYAAVAEVLAAASAPGRPAELAAAPLAVEAFRAARHPSRAARAAARPRTAPGRVAWIAAVAVAAVLLLAGTALATGSLRAPGLHHSKRTNGPDRHAPATAVAGAARAGGGPVPAAANATGLCRAYFVGAQTAKAKAAAFEALVAAAGGPDRVGAYCRGRVPPRGNAEGHETTTTTGQAGGPAGPAHPGTAADRASEHPGCAGVAVGCGNGNGRGTTPPGRSTTRPPTGEGSKRN